jgi:hypothetical protein
MIMRLMLKMEFNGEEETDHEVDIGFGDEINDELEMKE